MLNLINNIFYKKKYKKYYFNIEMNCKHCNKKLVPIGNARKNGKCHSDWASREYHKKCWITVMEFQRLEFLYKNI